MKGLIFSIEEFAVFDGDGIRVNVFFKGCPLRCRWCHNPEGWEKKIQIVKNPNGCLNCGICEKICSSLNKCVLCSTCIINCPRGLIRESGMWISEDDLSKKLLKFQNILNVSGGGLTFSGGEATLHTEFIELVKYARDKHMSVEIFTNGQTLMRNEDVYQKVLTLYPYRICISLYSTEKEMHERVPSVKGSFENSYTLVRTLREDNVNVQIKNFLLNFNCMDCIKVKEFAKKIRATSIADISLIPTIEGDKKTIKYALDEDS